MAFPEPERIFSIHDEDSFEAIALELFRYQAENNRVYNKYLHLLNVHPSEVDTIKDIPCLPIELFKTHEILTESNGKEKKFTSSGTSGEQSSHWVHDIHWYERSYEAAFDFFFPSYRDGRFFFLLPGYLERQGSSLVQMAQGLNERSKEKGGFFLNDFEALEDAIAKANEDQIPFMILGVTFGLLDWAESTNTKLPEQAIVMETGGMKGRRKELTRGEVHGFLKEKLGLNKVYSEYGMTELLSQAYSTGDGKFQSPPWMKLLIREPADPFSYQSRGKSGGVNIIDLANIETCAFIATSDLGKVHQNGSFEIIGRFDHADIRGCNLMVQ